MRTRWFPIVVVAALLCVAVMAWIAAEPGVGERRARTERAVTGGKAKTAPRGRRERAAAPEPPPGDDPDAEPPPDPDEIDGDELRRHPVTVRVVADGDGRAVAGALVRVYPGWKPEAFAEGRTGADGSVALVGRAPRIASLEVFVRAEGFVARHVDFQSRPDVELRLARGAPLSGRVVLAESGAPVVGAEVFAWDVETRDEVDFDPLRRQDPDSGGMTTDAEGRFRLCGLPPRHAVFVAARADGLGITSASIEPGAAPAELVLRLGEGGTIEGRVTRDDGSPAAGAVVWAAEPGEDDQLSFPESRRMSDPGRLRVRAFATTGADASFRLRGLPTPGRYVPVASGPDDARGVGAVVAWTAPGDAITRDLALVTPARISAKCVAPDGSDARVGRYKLFHPDGSEIRDSRFSWGGWSCGSEFGVSSFAPGEYLLVVSPDGPWRVARVPIVLLPGERKEVEVRFSAGLRLSGRAEDETGAPVAGARLEFGTDRFAPSAEAADDGSFVLEGLEDEERTVVAWDPERLHSSSEVVARPGGGPRRVVLPSLPRVTATLVPLDVAPENFNVIVRTAAQGRRSWTSRDDVGRFRVPWVPESGYFDVIVEPGDEFAPIVRTGVVVEAGGSVDLGALQVSAGRTAEGVVLDADGAFAVGAVVRASGAWGARETKSDAAGRFRLDRLPDAPAHISVTLLYHAGLHAEVACDSSATLRCERGVVATIALARTDGRPAAGEDLRCFPVVPGGGADASRPTDATTNERGEARIRLTPGTWEVWTFDPDETFSQSRNIRRVARTVAVLGTISVAADSPSRFELRLPP